MEFSNAAPSTLNTNDLSRLETILLSFHAPGALGVEIPPNEMSPTIIQLA